MKTGFFTFIELLFLLQTERDVSVRQRAVDLLYAMCDRTNAEEIVGEMLEYLETADYSIREEMVGIVCCKKKIHLKTRKFIFCCLSTYMYNKIC